MLLFNSCLLITFSFLFIFIPSSTLRVAEAVPFSYETNFLGNSPDQKKHISPQQQRANKEPIILDIDPGVDDVLNLFLMMLSPEVDVRAITLVRGNTDIENVKRNAVTSLEALYKQHVYFNLSIPSSLELPVVAIGEANPLNPDFSMGEDGFMGSDGLGDIFTLNLYKPSEDWEAKLDYKSNWEGKEKDDQRFFKNTPRQGPEEILYQLKHAPPLTVTLLTVGPLTNIATAYLLDPVTFLRAKRIVTMGGAMPSPGNISPYGEFNFANDPEAAHIVLGTSKGYNPKIHTYDNRLQLLKKGKRAPMELFIFPILQADQEIDGITITKQDYFERIVPLKTPIGVISTSMLELLFIRDPQRHLEKNNHQEFVSYDTITGVILLDILNGVFERHWHSDYLNLLIETRNREYLGACLYDYSNSNSTEDSSTGHDNMKEQDNTIQQKHSNVRMIIGGTKGLSHYNSVIMSRLFSNQTD
ncbi:Inosine/uridine-preferring nucleoside hydrolase domain-containing protein [Circinella umbellata]|nr:Inosine/uridine-preferring nucleoside hydrolase domain-containing protein [Circinella umbellata]